jgi:hypothetical protein
VVDKAEKAIELMERAKELGVRLEFDSSIAVAVNQKLTGDLADGQRAIIKELMQYLPEVRRLAELRALAVRARESLGKQIWLRDGKGALEDADGYARVETRSIIREGVLEGLDGSGQLTISIVREGHSLTVTARAEDLLIVLYEEGAAGASSPQQMKRTDTRIAGVR